MQEATFTLKAGKEVPTRLDGQVIRYTLPSTIADLVGVTGKQATITISGPDAAEAEQIIVGIFNEGFDLNHRQKIAKRFAARENSTVDSITEGMLKHVPGIRAPRGEGAKTSSVRAEEKAVANDMLEALRQTNPEMARQYEERLAAIAAKRAKPAATDASANGTEGASTATDAAPSNGNKKSAKK